MRKQVDNVNIPDRASSEAIFESLHSLMHLYRSLQFRALRDGAYDLTHMEHKVLGFFNRHPGATQSELVTHSGRDKAQLARLIGGLKEKGLLETRADERDRRSTRVHLTNAGRAIHEEAHRQARQLAEAAVTGLSQQERESLARLLEQVKTNLERG